MGVNGVVRGRPPENYIRVFVCGRFMDDRVRKYTVSIHYDRRLYHQDITGSIVHVRMLARQGIIRDDECQKIVSGLETVPGRNRERLLSLGRRTRGHPHERGVPFGTAHRPGDGGPDAHGALPQRPDSPGPADVREGRRRRHVGWRGAATRGPAGVGGVPQGHVDAGVTPTSNGRSPFFWPTTS